MTAENTTPAPSKKQILHALAVAAITGVVAALHVLDQSNSLTHSRDLAWAVPILSLASGWLTAHFLTPKSSPSPQ